MIRPATLEDIPEIVDLGRMFLNATVLKDLAPYDDDSAAATIQNMIESENSAVFVLDVGQIVGFITGVIVPLYWNFNLLSAQQCAYFVHPDFRGAGSIKLLKAWEDWAAAEGVAVISSGAKKDDRFKGMDDMLTRRGYIELESIHMKGVAQCQR